MQMISCHKSVLQTPFHLTLRLWDIYVLEGDRLLVAMAYCVMKVHRRKFSHCLFACSLKKKYFSTVQTFMTSLKYMSFMHSILYFSQEPLLNWVFLGILIVLMFGSIVGMKSLLNDKFLLTYRCGLF